MDIKAFYMLTHDKTFDFVCVRQKQVQRETIVFASDGTDHGQTGETMKICITCNECWPTATLFTPGLGVEIQHDDVAVTW